MLGMLGPQFPRSLCGSAQRIDRAVPAGVHDLAD